MSRDRCKSINLIPSFLFFLIHFYLCFLFLFFFCGREDLLPLRSAQSFFSIFENVERQEKILVASSLLPFSFSFSYDFFSFLSLVGGRLNILMLPAIFLFQKKGEKEKTEKKIY